MASTYSPKLRFELIGAGEQAGLWGSTTNKNVGQLIEQAIAGVTTIELDGLSGNYTLTALDGAPDQSRSAVIKCTYAAVPASGAINLIIPTQTKLYVVRNDCGQDITVKTSAQTGGVLLLDGEATLVFCDGTDAIVGLESAAAGTLPVSGGGTGSTTFTAGFIKSPGGTGALTSSSSVSLTADVSGTLPVANGGTGAASFTAGRALIGNGTGAFNILAGSNNGDVMTWSSALSSWVASPSTSGVASVTGSGSGINVSPTTGAVVIQNTGVTSLTGGDGIDVSGATASVTVDVDSTVVRTSGSQTIGGSKTFSSNARVNTGSLSALYLGSGSNGIDFNTSNSSLSVGLGGTSGWVISSSSIVSTVADVQKPGGGPFNSTSDARLKENVVNYTQGLAAVNALRPVKYNYNDVTPLGEQTKHKTFTGLIAQEVEQTALADMVATGNDGYKLLDVSELTFALVNAVKELSAQVDSLKAEVAALKGN